MCQLEMDVSTVAESLQCTDEFGDGCADSRWKCPQEICVPTGDESLQLIIELGGLNVPTEDGFAGRRCL